MKIKINLDPNYIFAFLHGIVHPMTIICFAERKLLFMAMVLATGAVTLLQYWVLHVRLGIPFPYVKALLTVTTALTGFVYILGWQPTIIVCAIGTGLLLSVFSHLMLSFSISASNWNRSFPLLVIGQLTIYFFCFLGLRAIY